MLKERLAVILFCASLYTQPLLAEDNTTPEYANVEGWSIRVDTSLNNGCFLATSYVGDTVFRLGHDNRDNTMYVFLSDPTWESIEYGKKYDVQIEFGKRGKWSGHATGFSLDPPKNAPALWINLNSSAANMSKFLREFMEEQGVNIFYNGNRITGLKLQGSFAAATKLAECQKVMGGTNSDPFKKPPTIIDPFSTPSSTSTDPFKT